jgi:hypothetical protein
MNSQSIFLSSNSTSTNSFLNFLILNDRTTLTFNLSGVSELYFPQFMSINWGDGEGEFHENDILSTENFASNRFSSIFSKTFSHEYFPSNSSTTKSLTANFTIKYINGDISVFTIPLSVVNDDFETTVEDVRLLNTVILPNNKKLYQFVTKKDGYLLEIKTSVK